ncbi:hypothetical protein [Nocardia goodfellowii]|uniref:Uncharacterized protein n=1 Tax=Nocardia goodfellowii TaxID=882446 RepID=A0ABS4QNS2_9NOCA|nr:hypothetical protein [Nocardia goodfellowii]MBP2193356.1 hypothetical protein [Nocardia goodfellowii]
MAKSNDHATVQALIAPLLQLRDAVGDGSEPSAETTAALVAAAEAAESTESPVRTGIYQLESTESAEVVLPTVKKTGSQVSTLGASTTQLRTLLTKAYDTRATAASKLDELIAAFRAKANPMAKSAQSQADVDKIIRLARDYIADGISVVDTARAEMSALQRQANALTNNNTQDTSTLRNYLSRSGIGGDDFDDGQNEDDVSDAQTALQKALISAGVTLGKEVISAGVTLGTEIIDALVSLGTEAIDKAAGLGERAMDHAATTAQQAMFPDTANPNNANPATTNPSTSTSPSTNGNGGQGPFALNSNGSQKPADTTPSTQPRPTTHAPVIAPDQDKPAPAPAAPAPANPAPGQGVVVPPLAKPPAQGQDQEQPRPRTGQLGVTPQPS